MCVRWPTLLGVDVRGDPERAGFVLWKFVDSIASRLVRVIESLDEERLDDPQGARGKFLSLDDLAAQLETARRGSGAGEIVRRHAASVLVFSIK